MTALFSGRWIGPPVLVVLVLSRRRGNELLALRDLDGALAAYTKAIDLDGSEAVFRSNRSAVYMSKGEHEKALVDAEVHEKQAWLRVEGVASSTFWSIPALLPCWLD